MKTTAQIVTSKIYKLKGLHERLEQSIATAAEARAAIQVFGRDGNEYQKRYSEIKAFITEKRFQIPRIQRTELNSLQPTQGIQDKISHILQRANDEKEAHSAALETRSPPKLATDDEDWVDFEHEYSIMLGTTYK